MLDLQMIQDTREPWQKALSDIITDPALLLTTLNLGLEHLEAAKRATKLFPLRVPKGFVARMQLGNIHDPLLRQVLPLADEFHVAEGFSKDPLQEHKANKIPGLLHKYKGRILLTLSGHCAINCRYCFRRHFPYAENNPGRKGWQQAFDYIQNDQTIKEVILSGGEPLIVNDNTLAKLITDLEKIPHLKRLRIHTRLPIVIPERITDKFVTILQTSRLQPIMVIHCNHANEIDDHVSQILNKLNQANISLLNQAVLLKGVNDNLQALTDLSETLFDNKVLPYYLHLLDRVTGTAHFEVPEPYAKHLYQQLTGNLPGFLVPKLVRELGGAEAKTVIL